MQTPAGAARQKSSVAEVPSRRTAAAANRAEIHHAADVNSAARRRFAPSSHKIPISAAAGVILSSAPVLHLSRVRFSRMSSRRAVHRRDRASPPSRHGFHPLLRRLLAGECFMNSPVGFRPVHASPNKPANPPNWALRPPSGPCFTRYWPSPPWLVWQRAGMGGPSRRRLLQSHLVAQWRLLNAITDPPVLRRHCACSARASSGEILVLWSRRCRLTIAFMRVSQRPPRQCSSCILRAVSFSASVLNFTLWRA